MSKLTDVELIKKVQSGNGGASNGAWGAFEELLNRRGGPSLALIKREIFSETDREDVQQIWREIAWRNIGKFDTDKYDCYGPFLTGAAVLAIRRFLNELGNVAEGNALLKDAINNPAIAFFPGQQPIKPPPDIIIQTAQDYARLIQSVLTAGCPPHHLMGFLLIDVLDENPAAAVGDPDRTSVRKIVGTYWDVPFGELKSIFLNAYSVESEIPLLDLQDLFSEMKNILDGVSHNCFADYCKHRETRRKRAALTDWVYKGRIRILNHIVPKTTT